MATNAKNAGASAPEKHRGMQVTVDLRTPVRRRGLPPAVIKTINYLLFAAFLIAAGWGFYRLILGFLEPE